MVFPEYSLHARKLKGAGRNKLCSDYPIKMHKVLEFDSAEKYILIRARFPFIDVSFLSNFTTHHPANGRQNRQSPVSRHRMFPDECIIPKICYPFNRQITGENRTDHRWNQSISLKE